MLPDANKDQEVNKSANYRLMRALLTKKEAVSMGKSEPSSFFIYVLIGQPIRGERTEVLFLNQYPSFCISTGLFLSISVWGIGQNS